MKNLLKMAYPGNTLKLGYDDEDAIYTRLSTFTGQIKPLNERLAEINKLLEDAKTTTDWYRKNRSPEWNLKECIDQDKP